MSPVVLDGRHLTPEAVAAIADGSDAVLSADAIGRMAESADWMASHPGADPLTTKWRWLSGADAPEDRETRVRTFIRGHCAGVGEALDRQEIRALIAARVNVLATGFTGARPAVAERLLELLHHDIVPVVPGQGSVGAAGVAQLAHLAWVAFGFGGEAWRDGTRIAGPLACADLAPITLTPKEALTLLNGATLTTARAALVVHRASRLLATAEAAAALSFEVVRADQSCLDERALQARNHPGGVAVAARMRAALEGSSLCQTGRRPDPFSIRCTPAVLGAAHDAIESVRTVVGHELNAACDNPLVVPGVGLVEGGNIHGAPVAMALDHLKIALAQIAGISERRTFRMTYGQLSGLPSFLLRASGLNSGLMLAQYTAASLVSECKGLAHPASVDSLPTVEHREDHVSMGAVAGTGAVRIAEALADILAIELLCGAQGLDFHLAGEAVDDEGRIAEVTPGTPGRGTLETWRRVRQHVTRWDDDRVLHPDLKALGAAVRDGVFAD